MLKNKEEVNMTITISVRKHFSVEDIANLMYSMPQGSSYWCDGVGSLGYESTVKGILEKGESLKLSITDERTGELESTHELTLGKIKKGLTLMAKKFPKHYADIITENTDCETSDILLQLALLGDIIYG